MIRILTLLVLSGVPLLAADDAPLIARIMTAADKNRDGKLALAEYLPLDVQARHHGEEHFKTGDANADGFIDATELPAALRKQTWFAILSEGIESCFTRLDTDKDGQLNATEYRKISRMGAHAEQQFKGADADKDGILSKGEFAAHAAAKLKALEDGTLKKKKAVAAVDSATANGSSVTSAKIPAVQVKGSPSLQSSDYVMDLEHAIQRAKILGKRVVLYTGHNAHLKKLAATSPRYYFENSLMKASPGLAARRAEFIVCELFEFTPMHDAKGNFTQEDREFITGWFGQLHDRYEIRYLTPTLNFLDSDGAKIAGPFENFAGFGEDVESALKKIPPLSK
jgi:Ca2+-binding EF-hand superfamily protein